MSVSKLLPRQFFIVIVASISLIAGPGVAQTAVPMLINFEGELRSPATGEPVPDGAYTMLFRIYDMEFGGTPLWEEIYSAVYDNAVEVRRGIVSVLIGSGEGDPLDPSLFNGADRWLEIRVEAETLEPRQRMCSVPYAMVAGNSRLLEGRPASDFAPAGEYVSRTGPESIEGSTFKEMLYVHNTGLGPGINCQVDEGAYALRGYCRRGVYGLCHADTGVGVGGLSGGRDGRGVHGFADGMNGVGVEGVGANTGEVTNHGSYFEARGDFGRGAACIATGSEGIGVYAEGADAGVYSEGDLVVTGAYRGVLGPNNGAPFPRPAYDSGWVEVPDPNRCIALNHDLGGDPDNYVVDMQFRDPYQGVHQRHYGGNWVGPNPINEKGLIWRDLNSDSIGVCRLQDEDWVTHFRVRIGVYN